MKLSYLDLSTAHISEKNSNLILETKGILFNYGDDYISLHAYPYDEGTFISIGEIEQYQLRNLKRFGFEEFAEILTYCVKNKISLLRFDRDAELMTEFQSFDW